MKRTYKKKSNLINKTGYTPGYDTEKNPVNYIPSEDITMANTPYPLYATPLDESGNPIGKGMTMQPGGEYKFPGAAYVAETPMFERGGEKRDWISAKISKLVREEGYPQKQAVAMAYEMYDNMHKNGGYQLPMYQIAGTYNFGSALPKPKFSADPNIQSPEAFSASLNKITEVNPGEYGLGKDPNYVNALSTESLTAGEDFKKRTDEINKAAGLPQTFSPNVLGAEVEDTKESTATTGLQKPDIKTQEPFQFFNPYGGVDIPSANVMFGQSLENKDTLGAIASGAKIALGTARNILGGMGQARRENYVKQQYYEKQREGMTGAGREEMKKFGGYYQEGGMEQPQGGDVQQQVVQALQQGMSPEEVMQQLVQMGMPEEQAMSLIQGIMQQMQGSTPQLRRGGMMYYQDGGEEDEEEYGDLINKYPNRNPQIEETGEEKAKSTSIESATEANTTKEETPSYDKNSARDTWVAKTGMPWSEAKRLGYTDGSAKDNMKLLSELNDPRFKKDFLRKKPLSPAKSSKKNYTREELWGESPINPLQGYTSNTSKATTDKKIKNNETPDFVKQFLPNNNSKDFMSGQQYPLPVSTTKKPESRVSWETYRDWLNDNAPTIFQPRVYKAYQDGGEQQVAQQVAQAMQQGMQPQEAMSMLMESGMTEDQAVQMVQAIMQQLEQQPETPQLRRGGTMYYQQGGDYDTYNEKDFKDNDIVRHSGGNTGLTKSEVNSLAKHYKMSPQDFLNIVSYGEPGEGMSSKYELSIKGSDKYLPKNWRETYNNYKENKPSTTGFRGALNKGLDYIGVDPIFNMGGYYQEGGMEPGADPAEAMMQQISQMLQQGAEPEQIMQMLIEAGVPEDQAMQMVQAAMQQMQGSQQPQATPQMRRGGGYYQQGGEAMDEQMEREDEGAEGESAMLEQVEAQVEQALKQGADPQQVLQQLVQMGIPQEVAQQMIEEILQEIQGGETGMEAPEEATPQMSKGGKYMRALVGKTIKNYTYNPKTDSYIVSYE